MKLLTVGLWCAAALFVAPLQASFILGYAGIESGVPIAGQEDVVIYNFTGSTFGCSTPNSTPICTAVTFKNVVIQINGSPLSLGDIAAGVTETFGIPGGVEPDNSITSLSFTATLNTTSLTDDAGHTFQVNPSISVSGLPVDGSLGAISVDLASSSIPEPATAQSISFCAMAAGILLWRIRRKSV